MENFIEEVKKAVAPFDELDTKKQAIIVLALNEDEKKDDGDISILCLGENVNLTHLAIVLVQQLSDISIMFPMLISKACDKAIGEKGPMGFLKEAIKAGKEESHD